MAAFGTARTAPSLRPMVTRPHAALLCRHTTPTLPHTAAALAPSSPLCAHGRELVPPRRRREVHERTRTDLTHVHRRGGRGEESRHFARMCRARQSGRTDRAPAEPPASGEAQRADGEVGRKGAAQHAVHCRWVSVRGGPAASVGGWVPSQSGAARGKGAQCVATPATSPRDTPTAHASDAESGSSVRASIL